MRVLLGGKQERVVKQEFEEVSIPPHLMTGGSDVSFLFFNLSCCILICIPSKAVEQPQESTCTEVVVGDSVEKLTRRIIEIEEQPGNERLAVKTVVEKVKPSVVKVKPRNFWCLC